MKTFFQLREATEKRIVVSWDMGDPREYSNEWEEQGIYLQDWDKRKSTITIEGEEKVLLSWLVNDYGMDKREAQKEVRKGNRV